MLSAGLPSRPPHCPNPGCDFHSPSGGWRFKRKGFFHRQRRPQRVQRYLCQHCGRTFSSQTFSTSYWLKRPGLRALFFRTLACSGNRQIARELGVCHSTVQRQIERLGRHCLLLNEHLRPRGAPPEPLVLDGFRSFESGQYWPFDLNHIVGESHFVYGFNEAELRRSGAMRPAQRRRRERLEERHGRPDPQATRRAVEELVGRTVPPGGEVILRSDAHPDYARAFRRLRARGRRIRHETTSSRAPRTSRNPLFPVNLADLLLRHCGSNHKRETIAFSKRRQGAMYRMAIFVVWRNYVKPVSERRRNAPPGVAMGVIERPLRVEEIVGRRLFVHHARLKGWLARCYAGRIPTRCLTGGGSIHERRYAA